MFKQWITGSVFSRPKEKLTLDLGNMIPIQPLWGFPPQGCFLPKVSSPTDVTSTANHRRAPASGGGGGTFGWPCAPCWALGSEMFPLFRDTGVMQAITEQVAVLIKHLIRQLASCCRGWRIMIPSVGAH